ncbi:hypothetical protein [Streptomyces sp. TRM68367]|uniref:hypothetical protein n=1 Tax=Streptomyces sp. TRM68367 TaxID=2758415 RepID=UPI00165CAA75|nr:hypothetical protein [Streptomyces sp. TRM68367]MBC9726258.1 hypothetical protein [Streptomyces sp. TRM68367]
MAILPAAVARARRPAVPGLHLEVREVQRHRVVTLLAPGGRLTRAIVRERTEWPASL